MWGVWGGEVVHQKLVFVWGGGGGVSQIAKIMLFMDMFSGKIQINFVMQKSYQVMTDELYTF